jgi:hypothetical protein
LDGTTTFAANQTWEIERDPGGSSHHIIKNPAAGLCIDIRHAAQSPGAILQTYPVKSSDNANQLLDFLPDPFGSGACFIQNPQTGLVIEIKGAADRAGTALVLGRRRLFDNAYQLWSGLSPSPGIADGTDLAAASLPTLTLQAPPPQFGGKHAVRIPGPQPEETASASRSTSSKTSSQMPSRCRSTGMRRRRRGTRANRSQPPTTPGRSGTPNGFSTGLSGTTTSSHWGI